MAKGPPANQIRLFRHGLLRVSGVARSELQSLAGGRGPRRHQELRERLVVLRERSIGLERQLELLVPRLSRQGRIGALEARRSLRACSRLELGPWTKELAGTAPTLSKRLQAWEQERVAVGAAGAELDESWSVGSRALRPLLHHPLLRSHLELFLPRVAGHIEALGTLPAKAARRAERAGFRYLLRAAMRPTPSGMLASTQGVVFQSEPTPLRLEFKDPPSARLVVNRRRVAMMGAHLLDTPEAAELLQVSVDPCCFEDGGRVWALSHDGKAFLEASGAVDIFGEALRLGPINLAAAEERWGPQRVRELEEAGVLRLDFPWSHERADDLKRMRSLAARAGDGDLSARLKTLEALLDAPGEDRKDLRRRLDEFGGVEEGGAASCMVFEDSYRAPVEIPARHLMPFVQEACRFALELRLPLRRADEEAVARLFDHLYGAACRGVPFLCFFRDYVSFCKSEGLPAHPAAAAAGMLSKLGDDSLRTRIARIMDNLLRVGDGDPVELRPRELGFPWVKDPLPWSRLSLRIAPAAKNRFHPVLLGGERMSLLPRYGHIVGEAVLRDFRSWMSSWPAASDIYGAFGGTVDLRAVCTASTLRVPGGDPSTLGLELRSLSVVREERGLQLLDGTNPVTSVFLGVSTRLWATPLGGLLLALSGRDQSLLEVVVESVNRRLRVAAERRQTMRLAPVLLGETVLVAPETFLMPSDEVDDLGPSVGAREMNAMHDRLAKWSMPSLVRVRSDHREAMWVDLAHPHGVHSFLRHARSASMLMVQGPLLDVDACLVEGDDGRHECELYLEAACGAEVPADAAPVCLRP